MAYVTTMGATAVIAPTLPKLSLTPKTATPTTTPTKVGPVTNKIVLPAPISLSPAVIAVRNSLPKGAGGALLPDGSVVLPSDNKNLLIAGAAVTVGLLLLIALRR